MISTGDVARGAGTATTPALESGVGRVDFSKREQRGRATSCGDRRDRFDGRGNATEDRRVAVALRFRNERRARRNLPLHEREQFGKVSNRTEPLREFFRIFSRRLVENRQPAFDARPMPREKSARERCGEDEPPLFLQALEATAPAVRGRRETLAGDGDEPSARRRGAPGLREYARRSRRRAAPRSAATRKRADSSARR